MTFDVACSVNEEAAAKYHCSGMLILLIAACYQMIPLTTKRSTCNSNISAITKPHAKRFEPLGQGPRWSCLMKKTGGRKSRVRVLVRPELGYCV
jgi:hypothetical protein